MHIKQKIQCFRFDEAKTNCAEIRLRLGRQYGDADMNIYVRPGRAIFSNLIWCKNKRSQRQSVITKKS